VDGKQNGALGQAVAGARRPRKQRRTGQSRIVAALSARGALDPELEIAEAVDITYAALSPDVHRILTVECGWTAERYEQWLVRSLRALLRPELVSQSL
jgi:hypothetical protein